MSTFLRPHHSGQTEAKIEGCRRAIELKPDCAEAYGNLGAALGKLGRYEEAVEPLKQALCLQPGFADAHMALGLAYLSLGRVSLAVSHVDALKKLDLTLASELSHLVTLIAGHR